MGRDRVPSYRLHRPSGLAVVTLRGQDFYLGKHGSPASRAEYRRLVGEWLAGGFVAPTPSAAPSRGASVAELILAYDDHAKRHYVKNGEATSELTLINCALGYMRTLYGHTPANDFSPLGLMAVRDAMVRSRWQDGKRKGQPSYCRNTVNLHVGRIRRMFRWAVANGIVPPAVYAGLAAVPGLQRGRTTAAESDPILPVPDAHVQATLPRVSRQVGAMIALQLATGMRPGEAVLMRACDLDTSGEDWIYRPSVHKTEHHGRTREIVLGPRAREIVRPFLKPDMTAFLFSPADAMAERREQARAARKTKTPPSQLRRRPKPRPQKRPGERYTTTSYAKAITIACMAKPEPVGRFRTPAREAIPHWHPNQLRHSAATRLRSQFGIETARVILGHSAVSTTEIYAAADHQKARTAMREVG